MNERVRSIVTDLDRVRDKLMALLDDIARIHRELRELPREVPHALDQDFTHTRPYGFTLQETDYHGFTSWQLLYQEFCRLLAAHDPALVSRLPANPDYTGKRGAKAFASEPDTLRTPLEITDGVYAEGNLSANTICNHIKRLLSTFGIEQQDMLIYLREDRDAPAER